MNRPYGVRPEPCEIQDCHAPHVVHGGMRNLECACLWQASATKDCGYRSAQ